MFYNQTKDDLHDILNKLELPDTLQLCILACLVVLLMCCWEVSRMVGAGAAFAGRHPKPSRIKNMRAHRSTQKHTEAHRSNLSEAI